MSSLWISSIRSPLSRIDRSENSDGWLYKGAGIKSAEWRSENRKRRVDRRESRPENQESRIENRESRIENREPGAENQESIIEN